MLISGIVCDVCPFYKMFVYEPIELVSSNSKKIAEVRSESENR